MSNHNKNNNLNYLIDPTFSKFNRLFVLPFENEDDRVCLVNILHLLLKLLTIMYWLMQKVFFDIPIKQQRKNLCKNY